MNTEKQNEVINAVGADVPVLYSGLNARITGCSPAGKAAMARLGEGVDEATLLQAAQKANTSAIQHATHCVWLGTLAQGKKEYLDARGNFADESAKGDGFEAWAASALDGVISLRTLRRYMEISRAFLIDLEAARGEVPCTGEALLELIQCWCGERKLAEIRRDVRAEKERKELKASPDAEPAEEEVPEQDPDAARAEAMLRLSKILDRALERDNELRNAFEQAVPELNNAETTQYLEALAAHYSELHGFYDRLAQKARQVGENAPHNV